jgi:DNA-binding transcriptional ArsR family regulator
VSDRPRIDLMQALENPMRVRILGLFTSDMSRPIDAEQLTEVLRASDPDVRRKQVAYHLTILREARLIPKS